VNHCHPAPLGRSGSLDSQPSWPRDNRPGLVDDLIRVSVNLRANLVMNPILQGCAGECRVFSAGGSQERFAAGGAKEVNPAAARLKTDWA
jgi:hypothetical protein